MNTFIFSNQALKMLHALSQHEIQRITEKLAQIKNHPDICIILKKVIYLPPATHRLRIGSYRLLLEEVTYPKNTFRILKIGHRREVYR